MTTTHTDSTIINTPADLDSGDSNVTLHWFLPTYGDSRGIMSGGHGAGSHHGERVADLDYLT